jgi:dihydroorotate dehydrogenase (fumarate)
VIASLDCVTQEGWIRYARLVEEAGADAVEVKSCPHGLHQMTGSELAEAVSAVGAAVAIPVIPKLLPQSTNPLRAALDLESIGADGVVMFNRFAGLDIDLEAQRPIMHGGAAGHGGPWSIYYSLGWIATASPRLRIPISASGGVWEGDDIVKYLLAGATSVQVCSAVCLQGYEIVPKLLRRLRGWMESKGYSSPEDFRGLAARRVLGLAEIDRHRLKCARVDPEACIDCGLCSRVCIYSAFESSPDAIVLPHRCVGCGLCSEVCPADAIAMVDRAAMVGLGQAAELQRSSSASTTPDLPSNQS